MDGRELRAKELEERLDEILPRHVFAYYSGETRRLEPLFDKHQERFYRELLAGNERPLRRLFYCRGEHSQFVLLAACAVQDEFFSDFLRKRMAIEGTESLLVVLREPYWSAGASRPSQAGQGDARFWYARGVVKDFLGELWDCSLAPIRTEVRYDVDFRGRAETEETLYLYVKDEDALRGLSMGKRDAATVFKLIESTYISDLVKEVRTRVKCKDVEGSVSFRELSEGEKQYLTVLGLIRFTRESESLFLLDEPDTHLNPAWKLDYLDVLSDAAETGKTSQLLVGTHDPILVAGLLRSQVVVLMERPDGTIERHTPAVDPRGLGVAGVLMSDLFGLSSHLDPSTLSDLEELRRLAAKDTRTDSETERLNKLSNQLGALDMTTVVRDPLYAKFVKAMSRVQEEKRTDLHMIPGKRSEQLETAVGIVKEILEAEAGGH